MILKKISPFNFYKIFLIGMLVSTSPIKAQTPVRFSGSFFSGLPDMFTISATMDRGIENRYEIGGGLMGGYVRFGKAYLLPDIVTPRGKVFKRERRIMVGYRLLIFTFFDTSIYNSLNAVISNESVYELNDKWSLGTTFTYGLNLYLEEEARETLLPIDLRFAITLSRDIKFKLPFEVNPTYRR